MNDKLPRIRRLVVLGSLYFKLLGVTNPCREDVELLNTKMHLAYRWTALRFPAAVSRSLWNSCDLKSLLRDYRQRKIDLANITTNLWQQLPRCLRYDIDLFGKDVQDLLDIVKVA